MEINEQNFDAEVLQSQMPVLVYFWATWCVPCKTLSPIIEELTKENEGKIKVGKIDADQNNSITSKYFVMSIPTLKFFKNGKLVGEIVGAVPKSKIQDEINKLM